MLFARFHEQLEEQGYLALAGQMIDAAFVEVPKQRNSREENGNCQINCRLNRYKSWGRALFYCRLIRGCANQHCRL